MVKVHKSILKNYNDCQWIFETGRDILNLQLKHKRKFGL